MREPIPPIGFLGIAADRPRPGSSGIDPAVRARRASVTLVGSLLLHSAAALLAFEAGRATTAAPEPRQEVELQFASPDAGRPEAPGALPASAPTDTPAPGSPPVLPGPPPAIEPEPPAAEPTSQAVPAMPDLPAEPPPPVPEPVQPTAQAAPPPAASAAAPVTPVTPPPEPASIAAPKPPPLPVPIAPAVDPTPAPSVPEASPQKAVPTRPKPAPARPQPVTRPSTPARASGPRVMESRAPATSQTPSAIAPAPAPAATATPSPAAPPGPEITAGWRDAVSAWLQSRKAYPDDARERGEEGSALVRFTVDRSGRVLEFALVRSTGSASLDAAVTRMLTGAQLPAFPSAMTQDLTTVTVQVRYALR